jgi:hypothetical protein
MGVVKCRTRLKDAGIFSIMFGFIGGKGCYRAAAVGV